MLRTFISYLERFVNEWKNRSSLLCSVVFIRGPNNEKYFVFIQGDSELAYDRTKSAGHAFFIYQSIMHVSY